VLEARADERPEYGDAEERELWRAFSSMPPT